MRKLRTGLGVEAFGVNAFVLEQGVEVRRHSHARQDELYFVHAGTPQIEIEGVAHELQPGSVANVPAHFVRQLRNHGAETAIVLIVGASGRYFGRDGPLADDDEAPGAYG